LYQHVQRVFVARLHAHGFAVPPDLNRAATATPGAGAGIDASSWWVLGGIWLAIFALLMRYLHQKGIC
jgi:hypothetical protein